MKKKKENKTIAQQKMTIVNNLIDNNFRCKDKQGKYLSISETDEILMNMPVQALENISKRYKSVEKEILIIRKAIKPLYNQIMRQTGLSHFMGL